MDDATWRPNERIHVTRESVSALLRISFSLSLLYAVYGVVCAGVVVGCYNKSTSDDNIADMDV
jgi:hypothetical protein